MKSRLVGVRAVTSLVVLVLVAAVALAGACGGDEDESGIPTAVATTEETHDEEAGRDHEEGAEAHDEDAEAFAYLEVAPKDSLFLVRMTNFAYAPDLLEANVGDVVEIAIQNVEAVLHDFTIKKIDADFDVSYLGGTGVHEHGMGHPDADIHFVLSEPGSGVVHIRVHEPGEYIFYCTVPGHRELGMEGKLIVR